MKRKYFGTNGIRGIFEQDLTPVFIQKMSLAIAAFYNKGTIVIGNDVRLSSPQIKKIVVSSLLATGLEVIDVGTVPTPLVQFAVNHLNSTGGIVITASHNPPEFNGIKVIDSDGIEIDLEKQLKIERIFEEENYGTLSQNKIEKVSRINLIQEYISRMLNLVDEEQIRKKKLRIVVDPANSVGGIITPKLLENLGVKVFTINDTLDGNFPGRGVEPKPEKLLQMSKMTLDTNADFAIAHDGDADRAIFGDNKGIIHYGDKSIALFEREILKESNNKRFVTPISSSKIVEDVAEEIGGEVIWTPVGCIFVSRKMIQENCILGGEENGGIFYAPHQSVRDGPMAAALMAQILANTTKSFVDLINELPKYHQSKEKITCPNHLKEKIMGEILATAQASEIITIDGVKLIYPEGWILIRPSGTEPIFRIFVETKLKINVSKLMDKGLNIVKKAIKKFS